MNDRTPSFSPNVGGTTATASTPSTITTSASFVEAQRRLATRRQERAAAEAQRRAQLSASSAAQRQASAAALRARADLSDHLTTSTSSPLVRRLESTARLAWDGATRAATTIHSAFHETSTTNAFTSTRPAFRVTQVDAELLDEELLDLLRGQVTDALQYLRGGTLQEDWQPEVMLLLRAALFKLSVWDHDATYGAALQNLRYADARGSAARQKAAAAVLAPPSKWQKTAYGLVTVGGRYAWTKWQDWLRDHNEEDPYSEEGEDQRDGAGGNRLFFLPLSLSSRAVQRFARITSIASDVYAGAALVSFLVFLRYGCYRTVLDRVLRMRLVPPTSHFSHEVSFEYLNRQLVWHAFTEFLLFLLPLVGIHRWRRWLTRTWRKTKSTVTKAASAVKSLSGREEDEVTAPKKGKEGELAFLPERTCAICYQDQNTATSEADIMAVAAASSGVIGSAETDITNPYEAIPCGCVYCYVSLATRIEREEGDGWTCLRCGTLVTSCQPWNGDVLEPAALSAANGAKIGSNLGPDGRPLSSSTNASGSPSSVQKTVGFADDVKGVEDVDDSDNDEIQMEDAQDIDDAESAETGDSDDESEAYEENEDIDDVSDG
ncbi:peroxisome assembly protein (Peroxin-2) [Sporothrix epigloea]|uniref:Peroxisome assembly protein (Peroxin-2) n=1 Tax=Sporothrix epigloea TaxID=1892477 RepID=A0ABP0E4F8_9PEZI